MPEKRRNFKDVLDRLIDDEGLRTEVKVTMTNRTLLNLVIGILVAGSGVVLVGSIIRKKQLAETNNHLIAIREALTK